MVATRGGLFPSLQFRLIFRDSQSFIPFSIQVSIFFFTPLIKLSFNRVILFLFRISGSVPSSPDTGHTIVYFLVAQLANVQGRRRPFLFLRQPLLPRLMLFLSYRMRILAARNIINIAAIEFTAHTGFDRAVFIRAGRPVLLAPLG